MAEPRPPDEAALPQPVGRRPRLAILLAFVGGFLLLLVLLREVLFPFLMAIFIAYLIEPVVAAVTKAPVFGVRWTRGPTIIVMYVLLLGGIVLASSCAVARVTATIKEFSHDVSDHLNERLERAEFVLAPEEGSATPTPGVENGTARPEPTPFAKDVVIPAGTLVQIRPHAPPRPPGREPRPGDPEEEPKLLPPLVFATLYEVVLKAGESKAPSVLLKATTTPPAPGDRAVGSILSTQGIRTSDGERVPDVSRIRVESPEPAAGLEVVLERRLVSPIVNNLQRVGIRVEPVTLRALISTQGKALGEGLPDNLTRWTRTIIARLALSIYEFILILMLTAFIVLDRRRIARFFASLPPPQYADEYTKLVKYVDEGLAGVIRGQLVICLVNGVLTYLGLLIFGVKGAVLLGFIAGVLSLIPIFGTIVSSIPIVLIAATDSIEKGVISLAWIAFIHLLEANLLNPLIMGSHARMHPVVIIFALLAGEHYFGVWGALLAVPTMSIIQSCFQFYRHEIERIPWDEERSHGEWMRGLFRKAFGRKGPAPTPPPESAP